MNFNIAIIGATIDRAWNQKEKIERVGKLVAFSDHHDEYLAKAVEVYGLDEQHIYKDYRDLIKNEDVNLVLIYNEPTMHLEIVKLCAENGIHCFVEKPFSLNLSDAEEMIRICEEKNVRLMANAVYGYDIHLLGLQKEIVEEKKLGDLLFIRWKGGNPGPKNKCSPIFYNSLIDPKIGGGVIMDYVPYGGIFYSYYIGGMPDTVYAKSATMNDDYKTVEDYAVVTLNYEKKGIIGTIECSWNEEVPGGQWFNIIGTKGTIFHNQLSIGKGIYKSMDYYYKMKGEESVKIDRPVLPPENSDSLSHFVDCIKNGKEILGMVNPKCARDAAEIIDAVRLSIKTGKEVRLPLKKN